MNDIKLNVTYVGHRTLDIEGDTVYFVNVSICGPVLLRTNDNQFLEGIVAEVFVQKADCKSDSKENLLRCATRRIEQLAREAHTKASAETR